MDPPPVAEIWRTLKRGWRTMLLVELSCTVMATSLLAPLVAGLIQLAVSLSGESALSDAAIAGYVLSPAGALASLVVGAVVVVFQLIGYAAMLVAARAYVRGDSSHVLEVFYCLMLALPVMWRLAWRFLLRVGLWLLPFAGVVALIHYCLLSEKDINYYLAERPPEFWVASGLAGTVVVVCLFTLIRLTLVWVHALPLVLFRRLPPAEAIRLSRLHSVGQRHWLFRGLSIWAIAMPIAGSILNAPWTSLSLWAARNLVGHLDWLLAAMGGCFALSIATAWLVKTAGFSLLAIHNMMLYTSSGLDDGQIHGKRIERRIGRHGRLAVAGALFFGAGAVVLASEWMESLHHDGPAVIIAHRGASFAAPENTLAAVKAAMEAGADWVEIDVQESADGTVMVFHDRDFSRMRGPAKGISLMHDDEIGRIDIGSWKGSEFAAERTPRLAEVLSLCKGRAGVLIELKYYGHQQKLEQRVVDVVEAAGMSDQVMVMSLDYRGLSRLHALRPQWKVGLLSSVRLGNLAKLDLDFLGLNARTTSRRQIEEARQQGLQTFVWTVNDPLDISVMLGRGVDGVITDDPALARSVRQTRAESGFGENLLLDLAAMLGRKPASYHQ